MGLKTRSWLLWLMPFILSVGMASGAVLGIATTSDAMRQEGPAGDVAGAAGALLVMISLVAGFAMATLTVVVARIRRRGGPDRLVLRVVSSVVGGGVIGALGTHPGTISTGALWILLACLPAVLAWPPQAAGPISRTRVG
jgi:hypothetical protein